MPSPSHRHHHKHHQLIMTINFQLSNLEHAKLSLSSLSSLTQNVHKDESINKTSEMMNSQIHLILGFERWVWSLWSGVQDYYSHLKLISLIWWWNVSTLSTGYFSFWAHYYHFPSHGPSPDLHQSDPTPALHQHWPVPNMAFCGLYDFQYKSLSCPPHKYIVKHSTAQYNTGGWAMSIVSN